MICRLMLWFLFALCATPAWATGQLSASQTGPSVTLAWDAISEPSAGYVVYVGLTSRAYGVAYDVGDSTSFTYPNAVPGQRYYFAVAAYAPDPTMVGPLSSEVSTIVPGAPVTIFLQPPRVSGATVTLGWTDAGSAGVVEYLIEAGSASGLNDLYSGSVGQLTSLTATVGPATYYVRLRGRTSADTFVASNEVSFSTGPARCRTTPPRPIGVAGFVTSGTGMLRWEPAPGATSYVVEAGSGPGLADVFRGNVGATSVVVAAVPVGFSAYARVIAINDCGQSPPSAEVLVQ